MGNKCCGKSSAARDEDKSPYAPSPKKNNAAVTSPEKGVTSDATASPQKSVTSSQQAVTSPTQDDASTAEGGAKPEVDLSVKEQGSLVIVEVRIESLFSPINFVGWF